MIENYWKLALTRIAVFCLKNGMSCRYAEKKHENFCGVSNSVSLYFEISMEIL